MSLKLYPDVPAKRKATFVRDAVLVALLAFFAWTAFEVYDAVDSLSVLGNGVTSAGQSIQGGFESAGGAVAGIPVIGDDLAGALEGAGGETGGNVAALGKKGSDAVQRTALTLGLLAFFVPALIVLAVMLPGRIRQIRFLTAVSAALVDTHEPERRRLLAMRAAFGLPYDTLLAYTKDPLRDLAEGRYDALADAALDDLGIRRSAPGTDAL
jgi:hypothetical protein